MQELNGEPIGLTPKQLADRIGVTDQTLYNWRKEHRGPPFFKIQRAVYYKEADVENWIRSKRTT